MDNVNNNAGSARESAENNSILLGGNNGALLPLSARMANRHGLIAGATGSGKTVSLQVLAEGFSQLGVPVFLADVKGDLSGLAQAGTENERIRTRLSQIGAAPFTAQANPVLFWDLFGETGHPVRATISDLGPLMLSHLLDLNETQSAVLYASFDFADDNGLLLLDLKDLRAMLAWMGENAKSLRSAYGNISTASIGAIQSRLLVLEEQGAENFFGEPALRLDDLMIRNFSGRGVISLLDAATLISRSPKLYSAFLLWLLAELYEQLPEVGDMDQPKLVLFFDEAHLLFNTAPAALLEKIEQVVRLIRSKAVGVYFISQSPLDIPQTILAQLGTRVQHTMRAFTPNDVKAIKAVAQTFRANPMLDTRQAITELAIGEALVSVLNEDGSPTPVQRVFIRPPQSQIGALSREMRTQLIARSPLRGRYDESVDRESAYEKLKQRAEQASPITQTEQRQSAHTKAGARASSGAGRGQSIGEALLKSAARSIGSQIGRRLVRGILGSLLSGR